MKEFLSDLLSSEEGDSTKIENRSPTLRGKILGLMDNKHECEDLSNIVPNGIDLQCVLQQESLVEQLSGNVAVVIISAKRDKTTLEQVVVKSLQASKHIQIALLVPENNQAVPQIPHDETFKPPLRRDQLSQRMANLYVRAYFSKSTEMNIKVNVSAMNLRSNQEATGSDDEEQLERLEKVGNLLRSHLHEFRQYLDSCDLDKLKQREEKFRRYSIDVGAMDDSTKVRGPKQCPKCEDTWRLDKDEKLEKRFEKIAADTWKCVKCGNVITNPEATDNWIA